MIFYNPDIISALYRARNSSKLCAKERVKLLDGEEKERAIPLIAQSLADDDVSFVKTEK